MYKVAGTETALNHWQLLCSIKKTVSLFFSLAFSVLRPRKASLTRRDLFCPGRRFLTCPRIPVGGPERGRGAASPAVFPEAPLFGYLRRAAAPPGLQAALSGSVSGSRRQPGPAGAEPAAGPARLGPLGAPERGGGVREPPEEDGLRTQQAELLQTPQKGKGRRQRSLPSEGTGREGERGAAPPQGTLGAAVPRGSARGAGRRTGGAGAEGGGGLGRAALLLPAPG